MSFTLTEKCSNRSSSSKTENKSKSEKHKCQRHNDVVPLSIENTASSHTNLKNFLVLLYNFRGRNRKENQLNHTRQFRLRTYTLMCAVSLFSFILSIFFLFVWKCVLSYRVICFHGPPSSIDFNRKKEFNFG